MLFNKQNLAILVAALQVLDLGAAIRYVDSDASGANNGTSWTDAWQNIINISGLSSGDTVYFSGGSTSMTYATPINWTPAGGSGTNYITYAVGQDSGHDGTVVFNAVGNNFLLFNVHHVKFDGNVGGVSKMVFSNANDAVVYAPNTAGRIWLTYITFPNMRGGLRPENDQNVTIDNCLIHKIAPNITLDYILYGVDNGSSIHNNTFLIPAGGNGGDAAIGDDCVKYAQGADFFSNTFRVYITNYPGTQHCDMFQIIGSNVKIYANSFENYGESCIYHDRTSFGTVSNVWVYNNIIWYRQAPASGVSRGFEFQPEQAGTGSPFINSFIANNTFVDCNFFAIRWNQVGTFTSCYIVNNLFVNCGTIIYDMTNRAGLTVGANRAIAGSSGTTNINPTQAYNGFGTGTNLFFQSYAVNNPNNDFHILASSGAVINAGTNILASIFNTDKDGLTRATQPTIGAYEFSGAVPAIAGGRARIRY